MVLVVYGFADEKAALRVCPSRHTGNALLLYSHDPVPTNVYGVCAV